MGKKEDEIDVTPWYMRLYNLTGVKKCYEYQNRWTGQKRTEEEWKICP